MLDTLENRFQYHPATTGERQAQHELVRSHCLSLAIVLSGVVPQGRELSLVLTKLEEAMFWANAGVARQE